MKKKILLAVMTLLASGLGVFLVASPAQAATCVFTGSPHQLQLFTSPNTAGSCWAASNLSVGQCVNVPSPYDNNASSFWNQFPANQTWAVYKDYNCTGEISYMTGDTEGDFTGSWNNAVSSVKRLS